MIPVEKKTLVEVPGAEEECEELKEALEEKARHKDGSVKAKQQQPEHPTVPEAQITPQKHTREKNPNKQLEHV